MPDSVPGLKRTLSGLHLWGIAVGLVISGEYFGWSYGWAQAGTLGFLITTVFIALMYTTFISDAFVTIADRPLTASIVTMSALGAIVTYWRLRLGASGEPDAMLRRDGAGRV